MNVPIGFEKSAAGDAGRLAEQSAKANRFPGLNGVLFGLIAVLWLATRPYQGLRADARFYMVQALHDLDPSRYADDFYFRFGSQDKFTVFSKLYSPLVAFLGVGTSGLLLAVIGGILWVSALVYLATGLIRDRSVALLAVVAVIALPGTYTVFGYGEPYVTPRIFAEAFVLASLGLAVRGRVVSAFVAAGGAAALHPLMALPGLAFLVIYQAILRPVWWWSVGAAAAAGLALAIIGVPPFADLRAVFDPSWFDIIKIRDAQCFVMGWSGDALFQTAAAASLVALALTAVTTPNSRRMLIAALSVGLGGVAATFLGADVVHDVFITELQPWRSLWLLTLLSNFYLVPTIIALLENRRIDNLLVVVICFGVFAFFTSNFFGTMQIAALAIIGSTIAIFVFLHTEWKFGVIERFLSFSTLIIVSIVTVGHLWYGFNELHKSWIEQFWTTIYTLSLTVAAFTLLSLWAICRERRLVYLGKLVRSLSFALIPLALVAWDQRVPWIKYVESDRPVPQVLKNEIPLDASVYWEGGLEFLWFRWRRPSYFSCGQGTGAVFSRKTALTYEERRMSFAALDTFDFGDSELCPDARGPASPTKTIAEITAVCAREPKLDYIVLGEPIEGLDPKLSWTPPVPFQAVSIVGGRPHVLRTGTFYVYSCAERR